MLSAPFNRALAANHSDAATRPAHEYGGPYNRAGATLPLDGGTAHFSVVDAERNAVAMTTTINRGFGSKARRIVPTPVARTPVAHPPHTHRTILAPIALAPIVPAPIARTPTAHPSHTLVLAPIAHPRTYTLRTPRTCTPRTCTPRTCTPRTSTPRTPQVVSAATGIVLNDEMDDFSTPGQACCM